VRRRWVLFDLVTNARQRVTTRLDYQIDVASGRQQCVGALSHQPALFGDDDDDARHVMRCGGAAEERSLYHWRRSLPFSPRIRFRYRTRTPDPDVVSTFRASGLAESGWASIVLDRRASTFVRYGFSRVGLSVLLRLRQASPGVPICHFTHPLGHLQQSIHLGV
jgi:hypothetical protein